DQAPKVPILLHGLVTIRRESHELVFPRIHLEPAVIGKGRIQQSQRMREPDLPEQFDLPSSSDPYRGRRPLTHPVDCEDRSLRKNRRIKSAGRMRQMMFREQ